MSPRVYLSTLARESRGLGGRLAFFVLCLAIGVAAVVAVAGLSASLDSAVRREARQLLAADLVVEGREPLPAELDRALAALGPGGGAAGAPETDARNPDGAAAGGGGGVARTDVRELVTVVAAPGTPEAPGASQLVELKVVEGAYPFYGRLVTEPDRPLEELLEGGGAVAAPELLAELGLGVGDVLRVGGRDVPITGVVTAEPDRLGGAFGFSVGPRLFLGGAAFDATGLETTGSRILYRALVRLPEGTTRRQAAAEAARIEAALPPGLYNVETWSEAQPAVREGIGEVERFLGLVALLSLLVGGVGVAQTVRAWLASRLDATAVLKCLGFTPRQVLGLYLGQTLVLGLAGSLVGIAVGVGVQLVLPLFLGDLVPARLIDPWQPGALGRGLGLGLAVAVLFALPPLVSALRVPPARVLRRNAEPLPADRRLYGALFVVLAAGIWGMAALQSGSAVLGLRFALGVAGASLALAAGAWLLVRLARRVPRDWGRFAVRHGLAALGRPGAATLTGVVALGLGVLVVFGIWLVERRLTGELTAALPEEAPSVFLVDIQPDQWPEVEGLLAAAGAENVDSVPVVTSRLAAIDGRTVDELAGDGAAPGRGRRETEEQRSGRREDAEAMEGSRRWALTREQRLTWLDELPEDNEVVEGALWSDPAVPEVSVERDFARDLGVELGSSLVFDVQGVPVETRVTSIRTVDWSSFRINFFLVVEPGVLDAAPHQRIAAARLAPAAEGPLQDRLAAAAPNVTLLAIREILDKVVAVLDKIALGIRLLGGFTALAGLIILAGAVAAGAAERGREVALLKTLGLTRGGVVGVFSIEYALTGLVAGAIGTAGGAVLAFFVLREMEVPWATEPVPLAAAFLGTAVVTVAAGLAASWRPLSVRPIEALRDR